MWRWTIWTILNPEGFSNVDHANLSSLPDLLQGAITVVDARQPDLPLVYCNAAFERLTGYASPEVIGRNMRFLQGPGTKPEERAALRAAIAAGQACRVVIRNYRKDGSTFWAEVRVTPVRDAAGAVTHFIGEQYDVTDRVESERALRDSEERFRTVLEAAPDATLITDREGRIALANARVEELFGYSRAELLGESVAMLMPPATRAAHGPKVAQFVDAPRARMMGAGRQLFACRKDGECFPADISLNTAKFGDELAVVVAIRDVTDRQQMLNRLEASERNFRSIAELVPVGVFRTGPDLRLRFGNSKFFAISGLGVTEMERRNPLTPLHPDDRALVLSMLKRAMREPTPPVEFRYVAADGAVTWALGHARPDVAADGTVTGVLGALTDITAYKSVEAEVRHQATLLNLANDAIIERDLDRRITFWNSGAMRLYGWSREEVTGKSTRELLSPPSEYARLDEVWQHVLAHGAWHGEIQRVTRDGRRLTVQSNWTLVRDAAGQPIGALSIDTDVTERQALETQMLRAQRMNSLGTMAGGIAHDLNNVLQPILLSVGFLQSELKDPKHLSVLEMLRTTTQGAADLIRQILVFARGTNGRRAPVRLDHLVGDVVRMVRETIAKDIAVNTEWADDIWTVSGDVTQLRQVVMNLCLNGAEAMPEGGTLTVGVANTDIDEQFAKMQLEAVAGRYVTLSVTDTGTGMSADVLDCIFEPFFTTKSQEKGTGLGLATVHAIVRGHDGFIKVYSEPGRGSAFRIFLPATDDVAPSAAHTAEHRAQRAVRGGHGELILVVDDEEPIRVMIQATMEKFGYRVATAVDGQQALTVFEAHRGEIAAVLTDMMMPALGGGALIDSIRRLDPAVKVIAMSGLASRMELEAEVAQARMPFLHKPFTAEQLLDALATVLHT